MPIFIHSNSVVNTTINLHYILQTFNLLWSLNLIPVSMSQCSVLSKTPSVNFSFFSNTGSVLESTSNLPYLFVFKVSVYEINLIVICVILWTVLRLSRILFLIMSKLTLVRISPSDSIMIVRL